MLSTKEVTTQSGISNRTLARWQSDGIVPPPTVRSSGNGRGRAAFYTPEASARIEKIAALSREGHTPREAATMMDMEEKRGIVPDDFAVPIYRGTHDNVVDLISWILKRQIKGAKKFYVGIEWVGESCVAYVDEHVAQDIVRPYLDQVVAEFRNAQRGDGGEDKSSEKETE